MLELFTILKACYNWNIRLTATHYDVILGAPCRILICKEKSWFPCCWGDLALLRQRLRTTTSSHAPTFDLSTQAGIEHVYKRMINILFYIIKWGIFELIYPICRIP